MIELKSSKSKSKFMEHVGVASWFRRLCNAQSDFAAKERIVWVDIEGVPLNAWTRSTFQKISSKWGELVELEDGYVSLNFRWKPTGKIFRTVGLRWVPTGKIFTPSTTKVDSEPPNGSNADITNQYESAQTLDVSAGLNPQCQMTFDYIRSSLEPQCQMTSVHNSSGLNPQCQMTSVHNSSGLNPQCQMTSVHNSSGLNPQCQMTFEQNGSSLAPQCQQKFIKQLR
ncbi:hypothetical protein Tco_1536716, partial [Tanacetum coccineum]